MLVMTDCRNYTPLPRQIIQTVPRIAEIANFLHSLAMILLPRGLSKPAGTCDSVFAVRDIRDCGESKARENPRNNRVVYGRIIYRLRRR